MKTSLFLGLLVCAPGLMGTSAQVLAQQNNQNGTLQLEATIRGNKEQPKVISIVPWQLPEHRKIDQGQMAEDSALAFALIERGQFVRQIKMLKTLEEQSQKLSTPQPQR